MSAENANFKIGQTVHHKLFDYRGAIVDVDPVYSGTDEWYENVAKTLPPKDEPWYHVLVDGLETETYVAERNLEKDDSGKAIDHYAVSEFFSDFVDGVYIPRHEIN